MRSVFILQRALPRLRFPSALSAIRSISSSVPPLPNQPDSEAAHSQKTTHFGFRDVPEGEKESLGKTQMHADSNLLVWVNI